MNISSGNLHVKVCHQLRNGEFINRTWSISLKH